MITLAVFIGTLPLLVVSIWTLVVLKLLHFELVEIRKDLREIRISLNEIDTQVRKLQDK